MKNWQAGGIKVGDKNIWTPSYADDIVLLAKTLEEIKDDEEIWSILRKKKTNDSPENFKIIAFRKEGGRGRIAMKMGGRKYRKNQRSKISRILFSKNNGLGFGA